MIQSSSIDLNFLLLALEFAKVRQGFCSPNPSVGCLITDETNQIIATGYHLAAGKPHAEIEALNNLPNNITPHTLYITLEPCCHHGKTPPCTDAIIQSGCKRVVYAYKDPNPIVSGNGAELLKKAGIQCEHIIVPAIDDFYRSYTHWQQTKQPFVTAKIALTLNGKIAGTHGAPIRITGDELNHLTHCLRKASDAILTTVKTILFDDPKLNSRMPNETIPKHLYIIDRHLRLTPDKKIFQTAKSITVFYSVPAQTSALDALKQAGVRCIEVPVTDDQRLDWQVILTQIGADGVHDLWVEAGGVCFSSLVEQQYLQRAFIYIAPRWLGEGQMAWTKQINFAESAKQIRWQQCGNDVFCEIHW